MSFNLAQARGNIVIEFVDKDYSRYTVFPVIASFLLNEIEIDKMFNHVLKMKNERFSFSASDYLLTIFTTIFLGIARFHHVDDTLSSESRLAQILGLKRFPTGRSLYGLIAKVSYWDWYRVSKTRFAIIKHFKDLWSNKRWLVIDIDQTNKLTEGKKIQRATPCFDRKRKGKLGLRLSTSQVEGFVFAQRMESGNTSGFENFEKIYLETEKQLDKLSSPLKKKRIKDKKRILRIDGGYFSRDVLNFLDKRVEKGRFEFIVRAKINLKFIKKAKEKAKPEDWQPLDKIRQVLRLDQQQILPGYNTKYTVLIIREEQTRIKSKGKKIYQEEKVIEYALITSIKNWSSKRVIKFYKKRQQIENIFRDYNQSFKANNLPSHSFWGNAFFFEMVSLVHNTTLFLSRNISPDPIKEKVWQPFADSLSRYRVS